MSIKFICRGLGSRFSSGRGFTYAAADIYFSAITPSSTGGQPASAFFMYLDGIPTGMVATPALIMNVAMYTLTILVLGVVAFLFKPSIYLGFGVLQRIFVLIGAAVQLALVACFVMVLAKPQFLQRLCAFGLKLLKKLHIVKKIDRLMAKLDNMIAGYQKNVRMAWNSKRYLGLAFLFNLLHRMSSIGVSVCVFRASGGEAALMFSVAAVEVFSILGYCFIPIPGSMGIADYMLLNGLGQIVGEAGATNLEMLSRGISFYLCILVCAVTIAVAYIRRRIKANQR